MNEKKKGLRGWRLGPIVFVVLLVALAAHYIYRYARPADRLNNEAVELMNSGKYDSALEKLEQALAHDPEHFAANYHRGLCLAEKHRWEEAMQALDRASEIDRLEPKAPFNKGKVLWHLKRFREAVVPLERAVELEENYPDAWLLLGECLYEIYLEEMAMKTEPPPSPEKAKNAFRQYLKYRPGASDRLAVEKKIEILTDVNKYPELLEKRREAKKTQN